jgi:hypothetical protein
VGPLLLKPAPLELDTKEATDLIVLHAKDMRIAARVRFDFKGTPVADLWPFEFTIRSHRASGSKTEMAKIREGFGDWFFYCHAVGDKDIGLWWLIDLDVLRKMLTKCKEGTQFLKFEQRDNGDGTFFVAFDIRSFPANPSIIIDWNDEWEMPAKFLESQTRMRSRMKYSGQPSANVQGHDAVARWITGNG